MTREDAYEFIKLYKQFQATGLKIVDFDAENVEFQIPHDPQTGRPSNRIWKDDWYGAKLIEANS